MPMMDKFKKSLPGTDKLKPTVPTGLDPQMITDITQTVQDVSDQMAEGESLKDIVQGMVEDEIKARIQEKVMDKIRPKLGGDKTKETLAEKIVEKAIEKSWDKIKEKIDAKKANKCED